jgi:hypothetical protein
VNINYLIVKPTFKIRMNTFIKGIKIKIYLLVHRFSWLKPHWFLHDNRNLELGPPNSWTLSKFMKRAMWDTCPWTFWRYKIYVNWKHSTCHDQIKIQNFDRDRSGTTMASVVIGNDIIIVDFGHRRQICFTFILNCRLISISKLI